MRPSRAPTNPPFDRLRMTGRIDLILIGEGPSPAWTLGTVSRVSVAQEEVHRLLENRLPDSNVDAYLFWDPALGEPNPASVRSFLQSSADIWHAGLALGTRGAPGAIDFVSPTWMLNRDPDEGIEATSWRASHRACLVRAEVLRWHRPPRGYETLDAAFLAWGYRCITFGVIPRHTPGMLTRVPASTDYAIPLADEFRFVHSMFGKRWARWAATRAILSSYAGRAAIRRAVRDSREFSSQAPSTPFLRSPAPSRAGQRSVVPTVSVVIPTLDRETYLARVLEDLRKQTIAPCETIVVDQSARPLVLPPSEETGSEPRTLVLRLEHSGQSRARNLALERSRGDLVLFLDDDDELPADLIQRHLETMHRTGADASNGVALEPTTGDLPEAFQRGRVSDVFPTNNTMLRRSSLRGSGLFDLAYDRGARADADLGMRLYLSGALLLLRPEIRVLHHHAPRGGLRAHRSRVVTYGSSRRRITHRHLPEVTEIYAALRYFSSRQARELLWHAAAGTMSAHGGPLRRTAKVLYGLFALPITIVQLHARLRRARGMLATYPQVPRLPPDAC
jgi:GT2 family glycosyltransferase